jgi:hypothetical protein
MTPCLSACAGDAAGACCEVMPGSPATCRAVLHRRVQGQAVPRDCEAQEGAAARTEGTGGGQGSGAVQEPQLALQCEHSIHCSSLRRQRIRVRPCRTALIGLHS